MANGWWTKIAFLQLLLVFYSQALECFNVNTATHRQVDVFGRERYFHGVNVVFKGPPWIPRTDGFDSRWSFSEKDMEYLAALGLNAIRLDLAVYVMQMFTISVEFLYY